MSLLSDIIQDAVKDVYASRYASLAASVIIVYDHLITLDNEFDLIWKSSWSIGKGLFIINRYYSLASVVANNYGDCFLGIPHTPIVDTSPSQLQLSLEQLSLIQGLRYYHWQGWTGLIACMIAETILQMRLYALYFLNKRILYLMVGSFILTSASAATIMSIAINQFQVRSDSGKRLVSLLIRDSVCYYVVMFATYLTCLLVWVVNIDLLEVPIGFSIAFSCVLGNRVIFNVRKVNQEMKGSSETTTNDGTDKLDSLDDPEPLSDTLTDFEMAQLRSLRADTIEGAHLVI
ncbi:hypothetical protein F5879DRAFT_107753 [Lentinula edodes]|nr:hypothetical protein F5879DRAFT_107753 [Lentinula edodes]